MRFVIDIPEREFKSEIADHFQDFFMRLQAEIQHRLISNDTLVCGNYELETVEMLLKSFKNATLEQESKTKIVTCKDCKHWHDDGIMTTCDKNIGNGFTKDYYCTDGERN